MLLRLPFAVKISFLHNERLSSHILRLTDISFSIIFNIWGQLSHARVFGRWWFVACRARMHAVFTPYALGWVMWSFVRTCATLFSLPWDLINPLLLLRLGAFLYAYSALGHMFYISFPVYHFCYVYAPIYRTRRLFFLKWFLLFSLTKYPIGVLHAKLLLN